MSYGAVVEHDERCAYWRSLLRRDEERTAEASTVRDGHPPRWPRFGVPRRTA
jgi:hypothetical protein